MPLDQADPRSPRGRRRPRCRRRRSANRRVVVAARRDMIEATLKPLQDAGLQPMGVDLSAFGMIRALAEPVVPAEGPAETYLLPRQCSFAMSATSPT